MNAKLDRATAVMLALKLVQPAQQKDIAEGMRRLFSKIESYERAKFLVDEQIHALRDKGLVSLYYGSRYVLTESGRDFVSRTGLLEKLENRRMYLLKETRRNRFSRRSDALDGSLKQ